MLLGEKLCYFQTFSHHIGFVLCFIGKLSSFDEVASSTICAGPLKILAYAGIPAMIAIAGAPQPFKFGLWVGENIVGFQRFNFAFHALARGLERRGVVGHMLNDFVECVGIKLNG
jgi:hypothetical protein